MNWQVLWKQSIFTRLYSVFLVNFNFQLNILFSSSCLSHRPQGWASGWGWKSASEMDTRSWQSYWIFSFFKWARAEVGSREHSGCLSRSGGRSALYCSGSELQWRSYKHCDSCRAYRFVLLSTIKPCSISYVTIKAMSTITGSV